MGFADDYVPVSERIIAFREAYPEGSLRPADPARPFQIIEVDGRTFLAYTAAAFRTPDDAAPGIGCAWEPVPGLTNFTRNSELQNAESSAWGRAIIAVGAADAKRGIASQEDVQNRQAEQEYYDSAEYAEQQRIPGLRSAVQAAIDKYVGKGADRDEERAAAMVAFFAENNLPAVKRMNAAQTDIILDHLMSLPDPIESAESVSGAAPAGGVQGPSADSSTEEPQP